jgi:hypothetical protein
MVTWQVWQTLSEAAQEMYLAMYKARIQQRRINKCA